MVHHVASVCMGMLNLSPQLNGIEVAHRQLSLAVSITPTLSSRILTLPLLQFNHLPVISYHANRGVFVFWGD